MSQEQFRYDDYIQQAKLTPGGHLHIGRGGFTCISDVRGSAATIARLSRPPASLQVCQ